MPATSNPLSAGPLSPERAGQAASVFKALADPARLRLLSLIASAPGGEICVCDLTSEFELSGPTISHHLKILKSAGLIDGQRRGTWVYYRPLPGVLEDMAALLRA